MKKVFRISSLLFIVLFTLFIALLVYAACSPIALSNTQIIIYDKNQNIIYQSKQSIVSDIQEIPPLYIEGLLAIEDQHYYEHIGFDPLRIIKAGFNNVVQGEIVEGASTLTQQYAKNVYLNNEQTFTRKANEILFALQLEMQYTKEEILEAYVNSIYYGHGIYGLANAANFYFSTPLEQLTPAQVALLIAIPNAPSYYSPYLHIDNAYVKRDQILYVFYEKGILSESAYESAIEEEIVVDSSTYEESINTNYYIDAVLLELEQLQIDDEILHIYTYYDPQAQKALSDSISEHNNNIELQTSGIIIEPYTSNIIALQGGNDYGTSNYNRALYAQRQVASTIKPLIYYLSLCQGFTPSSTFESSATSFVLEDGTTYKPENYNKVYPEKEISMIQAVGVSDNIYAVKTLLSIGVDTLVEALENFNIQSEANPSLALGCVNMSILQISEIYNTFASEGIYNKPAFIESIKNEQDELYSRSILDKQLLKHDETLILNQLLTASTDMNNNDVSFVTMYTHIPEHTASIKSGTSDWDTWCIGYNPYYTIGIWNGYDDSRNIEKADYNTSKAIWQNTFDTLMQDRGNPFYTMSNTIESRIVDPINGDAMSEGSEYWYLK